MEPLVSAGSTLLSRCKEAAMMESKDCARDFKVVVGTVLLLRLLRPRSDGDLRNRVRLMLPVPPLPAYADSSASRAFTFAAGGNVWAQPGALCLLPAWRLLASANGPSAGTPVSDSVRPASLLLSA